MFCVDMWVFREDTYGVCMMSFPTIKAIMSLLVIPMVTVLLTRDSFGNSHCFTSHLLVLVSSSHGCHLTRSSEPASYLFTTMSWFSTCLWCFQFGSGGTPKYNTPYTA